MTFSEKLKQAMQELHLNQRQVCGMTGKSKGSVSQYLSGKQISRQLFPNRLQMKQSVTNLKKEQLISTRQVQEKRSKLL